MLRRLSIALLAGTMLAGAPAPARAEPVTLAILGTIGITGLGPTAAALATFAFTTALSVGLNLAANLLRSRPAGPESGTILETQYGGALPRAAVFGEQWAGGHFVYANVYGDENKMLQAVYVLGDGLHDSLLEVAYNGKNYTLVAPEDVEEGSIGSGIGGGFGGVAGFVLKEKDSAPAVYLPGVWLRFFNGSDDQEADAELVAHQNPRPKPDGSAGDARWTTDHRGRGVCYVSITQRWNEEKGLTGYPSLRFRLRGLRLHDPRYDDTMGGDGTQVWGSPDTYVWSDNPAIQEWNYRRGVHVLGQRLVGMEVAESDLILPMYVAAANDCDDDVALKDGGTEKRYRCNFTAADDQQHSQTLAIIRDAMAGFTLERAGQFGPIAGVAQAPVTELAFTDDDLLVGEKFSFKRFRTRSEIASAIYGSYGDLTQNGEAVPFPARENTDDDAVIGERLSANIDLSMIASPTQAQRVAEIKRRASLLGEGSVVLPNKWTAAQPGDWIPYSSEKRGDLTLLIKHVTYRPDQTVALAFDVIAANVYSWTPAGDELPWSLGGSGGTSGTIITAAAGMDAEGVSLPAAGGLVHPGIRFTWTPIADPSVDRIDFELRKTGDTVVFPFTAQFPSAGSGVCSAGIQAETGYDYRHKLATTPTREVAWSDWATVTSGADHKVKAVIDRGIKSIMIDIGAVIEESIASAAITASKIAAGAIERTKFAVGILAPGIGTGLPAESGYTGPELFFNVTDGKLYRYVGGHWTAAVPAVDITGKIIGEQIDAAAITAAHLAAGIIDATKFAAGIEPIGVVDALPNPIGYTGPKVVLLTTDRKLYRLDGGVWKRSVNTDDLVGTIGTGLIEDGSITAAKIDEAAITAEKIAAGVIDATKFAASIEAIGNVDTLPNPVGYTGPKVVLLSTDRKLYRLKDGAWTKAVATADLTGVIEAEQLANGAVHAEHLGAAAVTAAAIAAGVIDATKFAAAIKPVEKFDALPSTGNVDGRVVFLTTDKKLYRYDAIAGAWTKAVDGGDIIANTITAGQIAAFAIGAGQIAADAITTEKLHAGAVSAAKLAVGTGGNLVRNSDAWGGIYNHTTLNNTGLTGTLAKTTNAQWTPPGMWSNYLVISGTPNTDTIGDIYTWDTDANRANTYFTATAGNKYEASVYVQTHRCSGKIVIVWYDVSGTYIGENAGNLVTAAGENLPLESWGRSYVIATAPTGAVKALIIARAVYLGGYLDPYLFTTGWFYGKANDNQTEPSPWAPAGATLIHGGSIITLTITADQIAANAITAAKIGAGEITAGKLAVGSINAGNLIVNGVIDGDHIISNSIDTGHIKTAAIKAGQIDSGAITTAKLGAGVVSADKIAAGAITASKLVVTDWANILPDNAMQDAAAWTIANTWSLNPSDTGGFDSRGVLNRTTTGAGGGGGGAGYDAIVGSQFKVEPGQEYRARGQAAWAGATTIIMRLQWFDATGAFASTGESPDFFNHTAASGGAATQEATVTPPSDARTARVIIYVLNSTTTGLVQIGGLSVRRRAGGNLIVDGAISAQHIVANSVRAAVLITDSIETGMVQAGAITATQLAVGAVTTEKLYAGAVSAEKLAVGTGGNLVPNSDCLSGTYNFTTATTTGMTVTLSHHLTGWYPPGMNAVYASIAGTPANGTYTDIYCQDVDTAGSWKNFPVTADKKYEASVYVSTHRCAAVLYIRWLDSSGSYISSAASNTIAFDSEVNGPLENWNRCVVIATAPAGAASANLIARANHPGSAANPYLFTTGWYFGRANDNQTEPSAWCPAGATVIHGGSIVATTITADQIAAATITGSNIAANTITAGNILANTITAGLIAAGAIGTSQLAAGAVTTSILAAGAVTANIIAAGTGSNLVANSDFLGGMYNVQAFSSLSGGTFTFAQGFDPWQPPSMGSVYIHTTGTRTGSADIHVHDVNASGTQVYMPASEGVRYEASAYMSIHGAGNKGRIYLIFLNAAADTWLGVATGSDVSAGWQSGSLEQWGRSTCFGTAPSGTRYMLMIISMDCDNGGSGVNEPYLFATGIFIGSANTNQTEFTKWSPNGVTLINGGSIVANSITASKIAAGTITATEINASSLRAAILVAGAINVGTILADNIILRGHVVTGEIVQEVTATPNYATPSNTEADISGASLTFTSTHANAHVEIAYAVYMNAGNSTQGDVRVLVNVDGSNVVLAYGGAGDTQPITENTQQMTGGGSIWSYTGVMQGIVRVTLASAGSHTIKLRSKGAWNSCTIGHGGFLRVHELKNAY